MKNKVIASERVVLVSALILGGLFFGVFYKSNQRPRELTQFETAKTIDYTMAKPAEVFSEYSLDGREIEEFFEGLPAEVVKQIKEGKLDKKKEALIAKKKAEIKKKQEAKKAQDAMVKNFQAHQTAYQNRVKAYQDYVKKNYEASVSATQNAFKANSTKTENQTYNPYQHEQNNYRPQQQAQEPAADATKKNDKKSFSEWRDLLFSQPTVENLAKFVNALKKNEVSNTEYQTMAQELLAQSDQKQKGLGLMALRTVPSLLSLSQLSHIENGLDATLKTYTEQSINAYLQTQNLPFLAQALATKDRILVARTLTLLNTNLPKLNAGDFSVIIDPRNRRDSDTTVFSMGSFHSLMPALQQIIQSHDTELAGQAQQAASLIQSSNNIAIN